MRTFTVLLCVVGASVIFETVPISVMAQPQPEERKLPTESLALSIGPHLFIDEHLIEKSERVRRQVASPERTLDHPVVTSSVEHQNWQPFMTVLYDAEAPASSRFRMWYNVDVIDDPADGQWFGKSGLLTSADGVHWPGPYERLDSITVDGRVRFGASVLDEGRTHPIPAERYKMLYFDAGNQIGPRVAFSADGRKWTLHANGQPILPKSPGDDIWSAGYDPIRKRYFLIGKQFSPARWTNSDGERLDLSIRRYFTSFSHDFKSWSNPDGLVYSPDEKDPGVTQWYGSAGFLVRGDLIIGFLRVLRDDLSTEGAPAEAIQANNSGSAGVGANGLGGRGGAGMGNTVLTWTRDGVTWHRDRHNDPYLSPDSKVGAWDHAMAWIGSSVPVGDDLLLYYAGYRWGHKYHHSVDRQIGVVKTRRDRFVAREAGEQTGVMTTRPLQLNADRLLVNVSAKDGDLRVQVTQSDGKPIEGFRFEDCRVIAADSLNAPVQWNQPLSKLKGQPIRLEFKMRKAKLFAMELQ